MSRIGSRDTAPEMVVRRWLWRRGYRYRLQVRSLPGRPDIVLRRQGVVIMVHGCFWHGHTSHGRMPQTNTEFWQAKIERNRQRDHRVAQQLRALGWAVITVWECQLTPARRAATLAHIEYLINHAYLQRQAPTPRPSSLPVAAESAPSYGS